MENGWTPAVVGALTMPQLFCYGSPTAPGGREKARTFEEREEFMERRRAEERAWSEP